MTTLITQERGKYYQDTSALKKYLLVYDSDCGPCTRFKNVISWLDKYKHLEYSSLARADELNLLYQIPKTRRFSSFHLISPQGEISSGSFAIPNLIELLPLGRVVTALIRKIPRGQSVVSFIYTTLSRLHGVGSCNRASLDLQSPRVLV
jgi:predicted DCC family thiol-disulfide oxidoreductase YuxK